VANLSILRRGLPRRCIGELYARLIVTTFGFAAYSDPPLKVFKALDQNTTAWLDLQYYLHLLGTVVAVRSDPQIHPYPSP
jgi:hypothetical protein